MIDVCVLGVCGVVLDCVLILIIIKNYGCCVMGVGGCMYVGLDFGVKVCKLFKGKVVVVIG